jgi:abelson tyrosine-protein kinase 1
LSLRNRAVTLPLWSPGRIQLGAVGFLERPAGSFRTLFNALDPERTSGGAMSGAPNIYGYGRVNTGSQRTDRRNAAQRGFDSIQNWLYGRRNGDAHTA